MNPGCEDFEECYRALLESRDCVYVLDFEGRFLDANQASFQLVGYTPHEISRLGLASLLDPEQLAAAKKVIAELQESGRLADRHEFRLRRKDGRYVDIEANGSVMYRDGRPYAVLGIARDITRLKQAERALEQHNEALLELSRFSIDLSFLPPDADLEAFIVGRLVELTGAEGVVFTEYDPERRSTIVRRVQVEQKLLDKVVHLLGRQLIGFRAPLSEELYREITTKVVRLHTTLHEASFGSIPRPVGAAIQALLNVDRFVGVVYLVEGSLYGTSLVALGKGKPDPPVDILKNFSSLVALALKRKRMEAALRESEEKYRLLAENAGDVIWTTDTEGRFTYMSPSVERLRGFTPGEMLGRPLSVALMPRAGAFADATLADAIEALKAGRPVPEFRGELEQPCKDGSTVWTEHRVSVMRDASGRWIGFQGVSRDVTERKRAEESIRESESQYRTVVDNIHEGIVVASGTAVLFCNNRMAEMLGYTAEEFRRLEFGSRVHPDDRADAFRGLTMLIDSGEQDPGFEVRFLNKAGDVVWGRSRGSMINWQGAPALIAFIEDITERKRAEAEQELSRQILEILNEPGHFADSADRIVAAIKATVGFDAVGIRLGDGEDFPYAAQDGLDTEFLEVENTLLERDAGGEVCREASGKASLACTCGFVISGKTDPANPLFTKGGSFWTNDVSVFQRAPRAAVPRLHPRDICARQGFASIALVPIRDKQNIVGLIHLADRRKGRLSLEAVQRLEDMAAHMGSSLVRKHAEAALQESRERYQTLVNLSPDAIVVDVDGTVMFANPAAAVLFGAQSPGDVVGATVSERVHPDFRSLVAERAAQVAAGRVSLPREIVMLRLDGSPVEVEATAARIEFDGHPARQVVFRDITERRQAEARHRELERQLLESQKLESLGVLAGGIAHDFNNMLTAILGYSDMILAAGAGPPEETLADVAEIKQAAERAKGLTEAILAFSRRQPREPRIVALGSLVSDLEPLLRRTLGEDIDLVCRLSTDAPVVEIDPSQFTQVLMNLVVNARDAMPAGGALTLEVTRRRVTGMEDGFPSTLAPGDWSVLIVSDTGVGIDPDTVHRIFEPFFTTKGPGEGTGLGLSTAYGIVKQSGGDIVVRSEPGGGTSFEVYLPAADLESGGSVASGTDTERQAKGPVTRRMLGETVLVVEDEPAVRKLATRILREQGFSVLVASDGPQALEMAGDRSLSIDVLLTDVVLPGVLQGDEVARGIRVRRPAIKVVFMSGYPRDAALLSGGLEEGIGYLEKPFTAHTLLTKLREVLDPGAV